MEEYLIFAAIGGLLLLTLFVNSMAEAYEQKQRQIRIKILRIKRTLDELSELLDAIKSCDVSDTIRDLITNEIMSRLQKIQTLDKHFRGVEALIEEANDEQKPAEKDKKSFYIRNDAEFLTKMVLFRRLIKLFSSNNWYSKTNAKQREQSILDLKLLKCEKIFQFYSDKAVSNSEKGQYMVAKEHYYYIIHALKSSTITSNERVIELIEQTEFMMGEMNKKLTTIDTKNLNQEKSQAAEKQAAQSSPS